MGVGREVEAVHVFHDLVELAVGGDVDMQGLDDAGVADGGGGGGFAEEAVEGGGVGA